MRRRVWDRREIALMTLLLPLLILAGTMMTMTMMRMTGANQIAFHFETTKICLRR
jgi:hypothetical protein